MREPLIPDFQENKKWIKSEISGFFLCFKSSKILKNIIKNDRILLVNLEAIFKTGFHG